MRRTLVITACLLFIPFAWATGDHQEGKMDLCDNDVDPHDHGMTDGHAHDHMVEAHGGMDDMEHEEGAHQMDMGCDQSGFPHMMWDAPPLPELALADAVIGYEPSVIIGKEAYGIDVDKTQTEFNIQGDAVLAAMGFPGSGTMSDPYVIEGYAFTERLTLKDTDACVTIRNNVFHGSFIEGPLASPDAIQLTQDLLDEAKAVRAQAISQVDAALAASAQSNAALVIEQGALAAWADERPAYLATYHQARDTVADHTAQIEALNQKIGENHAAIVDLRANLNDANLPTADQVDALIAAAQEAGADAETVNALIDLRDEQTSLRDQRDLVVAARTPWIEARTASLENLATYDEQRPQLLANIATAQALQDANLDALNAARAQRTLANEALDTAKELVAQGDILYENVVYPTMDDLIRDLLALAAPAASDAQLVLDWNSNCVWAYNNVIDDLRVNQNNARLGVATGGVLEDNRIYEVGQLRHYDGIFRSNEVGDRAHLAAIQDGETIETERAANVDGFNQGMLLDNIFYGSVDLDFHGHHHSAGFFATHSHYHGNDETRKHMMDHTARWTSVQFAGNTIIDPAGPGLRYEDQNHAGDDRTANSESEASLDKPHTHRSWIVLQDNTIIGALQVDVFNADGIWVWSDDLAPVKFDALGRIIDAIQHAGANIVNTHEARNTGWLDIKDNRVFAPSGMRPAYDIGDAKEFLLEFTGNEAISIGQGASSGVVDYNAVNLYGLDWGGEQTDGDVGLRFARLKDGEASVCTNELLNFDAGFQATMNVREDVKISTCGDNVFSGDPEVEIRLTPMPEGYGGVTGPIREFLPDSIEHAAALGLDQVDIRFDQVEAIADPRLE